MMTSDFNEIRSELLDIHEVVGSLGDNDILNGYVEGLQEAFSRLDTLAAMKVDEETVYEILEADELQPVLSAISRLRNIYGLRLEIEQAKALLASHDPWSEIRGFTFYNNYLELASMEQRGANLMSGDSIIFLGSGPLPLSLIIMCSRYNLKGMGIERDASYAELARRLIDHLDMSHQISIVQGDHFSLPRELRCNLLMVAAMARPKQEIFNQLAAILPEGSLVSYRLYEKGLRRILDMEEPFILPSRFVSHCRIRPLPPVNNTVVVIRREGT